MLSRASLLLLAWALGANAPIEAQEAPEWFPPEAREVAARELAGQVRAIEGVEDDEAESLRKARITIDALLANLDALGPQTLIELAPSYPDLELPGEAPDALAAIGRYGLCSAFLQALYHDRAGEPVGIGRRVSSAVGLATLPLVSGKLMQELLADGVSPEEMKSYLDSEASRALFDRVWNAPDLLAATQQQCDPVLERIVKGG